MALFAKKKATPIISQEITTAVPAIEASILRKNNIVLLTIDERWTSLFSGKSLPPKLNELQNIMNDMLRKEASLRQEMENIEPSKKKALQQIMKLTKDAFEGGDAKAKDSLQKSRDEIERINLRWSSLVEEIDTIELELKELNLQILKQTVIAVIETMQKGKEKLPSIVSEISRLEKEAEVLKDERNRFIDNWNLLSEPFTKLYGTEYVHMLESTFVKELQETRLLFQALNLKTATESETETGHETNSI